VGLSTDVDDLKRTQKLLEESQALRERFTNTLTHDLRNPLTAAKMSAQLVLRSREDAEKRDRHLHKITEAIERADRMIGDLLDANRIKAGEALPLRLTDCDLRAIAVQSLDELSVLYGDRFVLRDDGPCVGHWSCEGLRRVVDNLATNAVKYGAPNSPITVTLTHHEGEVRIQVHNEGNELSQEELGGLFDLYKRSRKAEASEVKGWGIGLTLVKGIVEAHGGRVKAESGRGAGTTFTVDLPRRFTP
jgi:signal transduction histidine kinase